MLKPAALVKIGSEVSIDLRSIKDRVPTELVREIARNPRAKVVDYKMTDGTGIGLVLQLSSGTTSWFFETEIQSTNGIYEISQNGDIDNDINSFINIRPTKFQDSLLTTYVPEPSKASGILDMFNPTYFFRWLLYSLKDVF